MALCPCRPPGRENRALHGPRQHGRMTSPAPACYQASMEWIIIAALAMGLIALVAVFVLRAKRHDGGTVRGWFEFDKYKDGENSKRSLHDKARRR